MKKIPILLLCTLLFSTALLGCQSEPASQPQTSDSSAQSALLSQTSAISNQSANRLTLSERKPENQLEAVTIATTFPKYPVENIKEISFTINPEEKTERMRTNIDLEIEKNGIWYRIEPNHGTTGTAQESLSNTYYIDFLQWSKFDFPAGHYRVVLLPYQTQEEPWVAGEFWLVPKEEAPGVSNDGTVKANRDPAKQLETFSLTLEKNTYPAGIHWIPMTAANHSSEESSFADNTLELDILKEDGWYTIPRDALAEYAGIFPAGEQRKDFLSLGHWFPQALYPGHYRVVHQEMGKWIATEFDLVADPSPTWKLENQSQQSWMLDLGIIHSGTDAQPLTILDEPGSPFLTAIDRVDLQIQTGETWKSVSGDVSVPSSLFDLPQLPYEGNTHLFSFVSGDPKRGNLHLGFQPDFWPGAPLEPGHYRLIFASGNVWVGSEFFLVE